MRRCILIATALSALTFDFSHAFASEETKKTIDFEKEIEPLLRENCYGCHGPEQHKGHLRLDMKVLALQGGESGRCIIPGASKDSLLMQRILGLGTDNRMPLKREPLTASQIATVETWIDQGAQWPDSAALLVPVPEKHWAYKKPINPIPPIVRHSDRVNNPIDQFVLAKLENEGLSLSPEAPREILIRRLSLDLTGLPPALQEVDDFVADKSPNAYEKVVNRLLDSSHYGERWAMPWLDLARYADTQGYEKDNRRQIWKYRDWVINALNQDMPFSQFTVEQIAGDLIPDSTIDQKIATGFHRNTMKNEEAGVDRDEAHWETVIDRVNTTATVWLGTTLGCAQCHDHKYDPISQNDYYRFLAFFDNADEPAISTPTLEEQARMQSLEDDIAVLERKYNIRSDSLQRAQHDWENELAQSDDKMSELPENVQQFLRIPSGERDDNANAFITAYYRTIAPELKDVRDLLNETRENYEELKRSAASTLVLRERPTRDPLSAFTRIRGGYLNKGERVYASVPSALHPWRPEEPVNRLGLAHWLVDPENPLTARVTVNRIWEQYFGQGLVSTTDDLGTQGERPSNQALLDYLATEFVRSGWSMKALHRMIVTSSTYRQSSKTTPENEEADPGNRLLSRGPRFRLQAETIRDVALAASGKLNARIGGPSVFPSQPDGIWSLPYNNDHWTTEEGENSYRRGMYTFWRRTSPYPAFTNFDAPSREVCCARRNRTNTPIQALTTLNDPAYFDLAKSLAARMVNDSRNPQDDPKSEIRNALVRGFRLCVARKPTQPEIDRLISLYNDELQHFKKDKIAAEKATTGESVPHGWDAPQFAAMTMAANVLLNLDETLTKE